MKKIYNAPEVELLRFAPAEQIANSEIQLNPNSGDQGLGFSDPNAIVVPLDKLLGL